jgi:hypothetical protein
MPTLPDSRSLRRAIPQSQRAIVQDRSGEILAEGVANAADSVMRTQRGVQEKRDRFTYAAAKSEILQADIEARKELENDEDWATYEQRYRERMQKVRETAAAKVRDPADRALFDQDTKLDVERGAADIRGAARKREVDWGRSTLEANLAANQQAAWKAADEATRTALVKASEELIEGAIAKGYVAQEEGGTVKRKFAAEYARGAIDMMPTEAAIAALTNPKKGSPGYLLEEPVRVAMLEQLQKEQKREREAAENHAYIVEQRQAAAVERAQRNAADLAWQHMAAGGTVATMPKAIWRAMDGKDQIAVQDRERKEASGENIQTDRATYLGLLALSTDPSRTKEWKEVDLRRYSAKLADPEFKQLAERWAKAGDEAARLESLSEDRQIALAVADVKAKDADGATQFERAVHGEITAEQQRLGRKLSADERQRVIDRQLIEGEVVKPGFTMWDTNTQRYKTFNTTDAKYFVPDGYDDIPAEEVTKIQSALDRAGRAVTPAAVFDLWTRKQGSR